MLYRISSAGGRGNYLISDITRNEQYLIKYEILQFIMNSETGDGRYVIGYHQHNVFGKMLNSNDIITYVKDLNNDLCLNFSHNFVLHFQFSANLCF